MLRPWTERPLAELLEAYGLGGVPEEPFPNDGWSGASLTRLVRPADGRVFILKRTSWATDWIARSTRDHALREGFVASMPIPLPHPLVAPYHGVAADGTAVAILMPDLSAHLLGWSDRRTHHRRRPPPSTACLARWRGSTPCPGRSPLPRMPGSSGRAPRSASDCSCSDRGRAPCSPATAWPPASGFDRAGRRSIGWRPPRHAT